MKLKMIGWARRTKVSSAISLEPLQLLSCYLAWVKPNRVVNSNRLGYEFGIKTCI